MSFSHIFFRKNKLIYDKNMSFCHLPEVKGYRAIYLGEKKLPIYLLLEVSTESLFKSLNKSPIQYPTLEILHRNLLGVRKVILGVGN